MDSEATAALAAHYGDLTKQGHAARLGMWLFLGTEVLLFGGLFVGYSMYRYLFQESFHEASRHLDTLMGAFDTVILLSSSLFAVLSLHFLRAGRMKRVVQMLLLTMAMGLGFLVAHGYEYWTEWREGALPGPYYHFEEVTRPGASMFFTLYFLMTGLHSLHVIAGVTILGYMAVRAHRGRLTPAYDVPLEVATLYWHLVDVIWIFLFPLLYLI